MIETPSIGIVKWAIPTDPRIIKGIEHVGGLVKLTALGENNMTNLAKSTKNLAGMISCFAIINSSYNTNLAKENTDNEGIMETAKRYGVWLLNYAETTDFDAFKKQLLELIPNR